MGLGPFKATTHTSAINAAAVLSLLVTGSVLVFSSTAVAQWRGSSADSVQGIVRHETSNLPFNSVPIPTGMASDIQFVSPMSGMGPNAPVLEALVGSTVKALDWPQLPRVFWKFDRYTNETVNHYAGLSFGKAHLTGTNKNSVTFKYNRSTGLILVGSLRPNNRQLTADEEQRLMDKGMAGTEPMVIEDPTSGVIYPNVRNGYPLVGMCVFEVSIMRERTGLWGIDFFGNGHNREQTDGFGTPFTLFSNFFQLDPRKKLVGDYIEGLCQQKFEAGVKEWVEKQFFTMHRAYRTEKESTCLRERGGVGDRMPEGDRVCMAWHSQLPDHVRRTSVGRCVRHEDDLFHCVAVTKQVGASCPFAQSGTGKIYVSTSVSDFGSETERPSLPCDPARGLRCVSQWPTEVLKSHEENRVLLDWATLSRMGRCQRL